MAIHRRGRSLNLTASTNDRLGRALIGSLRSRSHTPRRQLDDAVGEASREFRLAGLDDLAVLTVLGELVEDIGRECGADRPSLMTGELRWMPVRTRVLETARLALAVPALS